MKVAKVELNAKELHGLMNLLQHSQTEKLVEFDVDHLFYVFAQHWDHLTNFGDDYEL